MFLFGKRKMTVRMEQPFASKVSSQSHYTYKRAYVGLSDTVFNALYVHMEIEKMAKIRSSFSEFKLNSNFSQVVKIDMICNQPKKRLRANYRARQKMLPHTLQPSEHRKSEA